MSDERPKYFLYYTYGANHTLKELKPYYYEQCCKYTATELKETYGLDVSHMRLGNFEIIDKWAIWYCGYSPYSGE